MTSEISLSGANQLAAFGVVDAKRAAENFERLLRHVAALYCMGDSSSLSAYEARELAASVAYVLGIAAASPEEAAKALDVDDPIKLWHDCLEVLDARMDSALEIWSEIVAIMPPLKNVALRDTLASLGKLRSLYDTRFAAYEVPCDIDYQLSEPVDPDLQGIDYIEAWLAQLMKETQWIARFDPDSCKRVLDRICPDYRGLHVNLYDLLLPHVAELEASSRTFTAEAQAGKNEESDDEPPDDG